MAFGAFGIFVPKGFFFWYHARHMSVEQLVEKYNLHHMAKVGDFHIYMGDLVRIRDLHAQNNSEHRNIASKFYLFGRNPEMDVDRWHMAKESSYHRCLMEPVQWESFRKLYDHSIGVQLQLVGQTIKEWETWGESPPLYVHHPVWRNAEGYSKAKCFGLRKSDVDWFFQRKEGRCIEDGEGKSKYIYDLQLDGRFKLRNPEQFAEHKGSKMSEETTKTIQSTPSMIAESAKAGGMILMADRANKIVSDKGAKKILAKMGFSAEFLNTEAGDLLVRWAVPILINEMCSKTNLIPRAEFVSAACAEAMKANTIHTLMPVMEKAMPMLTALAEVGKEIVDEQKANSKDAEPVVQ